MKKIELLAPAGDTEAFIAAVQNGANAIYLGGTMFNARSFAKNFDNDELLWAVEYAHLRNVKIFVTVNTLYKDEEFEMLLEYIDYLYTIQIDALIIQDIGLCSIVHEIYPDFEIHMSTQASVMNKYGVKFFEKRGVSRIVLARENSIEEIQNICSSTSLDIEVFVHGALCICYSGQCLLSSFIGKRSGNRGECAQPCRLKYRLVQDNIILEDKIPYLLSPKDLMTIENIGKLIDAGVCSFKIEGRMKRPEYVGSVVKAYRNAIDNYINQQSSSLDRYIYFMKSMFNRDYTKGYIFHDSMIVEGDYSGNKGIIIGYVMNYNKNKKRVLIRLKDTLQQGDSIVFENIDKGRPINKIYIKGKLVHQAYKNDIVEIEFDFPVYHGNVRKTLNLNIIQDIQKSYQKENIKQPIQMKFVGQVNKPLSLTIIFKDIVIQKQTHDVFGKTDHNILTQERIHQQLSKLGQTVFFAQNIDIKIDEGIMIPIKIINELRRDAIYELSQRIIHKKIYSQKRIYQPLLVQQKATSHNIYVLASHYQQLEEIVHYPIQTVFYPYQKDVIEAYELCLKHHIDFALFIPRICKDKDIEEILNSSIYQIIKKVVVNDYGSYYAFQDKERIIGTGLNIFNSYAAQYYKEEKILSLEMSYKQLKQLKTNYQSCILQIYGKIENMISEYCPISQYYFGKQKRDCHICQKHQFSIIDRKNEKFNLMMDEKCRMHLLNCKTLYIDNIEKIPTQGLFLHFTNEEAKLVNRVLNDYFHYIFKQQKSHLKQQIDCTLGYFKV